MPICGHLTALIRCPARKLAKRRSPPVLCVDRWIGVGHRAVPPDRDCPQSRQWQCGPARSRLSSPIHGTNAGHIPSVSSVCTLDCTAQFDHHAPLGSHRYHTPRPDRLLLQSSQSVSPRRDFSVKHHTQKSQTSSELENAHVWCTYILLLRSPRRPGAVGLKGWRSLDTPPLRSPRRPPGAVGLKGWPLFRHSATQKSQAFYWCS